MPQRITFVQRQVGGSQSGGQRVTHVARMTVLSHDDVQTQRVTQFMRAAAVAQPGGQRVTTVKRLTSASEPGPQRVTALYRLRAVSPQRGISFPFTDFAGEIWDPWWSIDAELDALVPEWNPYRPTIPNEYNDLGDILYDFQKENQETQRAQHNLIQAGDTTFPWQKMTRVTNDKLYTLGSIGRFYHETYGLMIGRYVQFQLMDDSQYQFSPVGYCRQSKVVDWQVTNRITESHVDMVAGVIAGYERPLSGQYGWITISGAALAMLYSDSEEAKTHGTPVSWASGGKVSATAAGRILGRRVGNQPYTNFLPGELFVEIESWSAEQIKQLALSSVQELVDQVESLSQIVTNLSGQLAQYGDLTQQIAGLRTSIQQEASTRAQEDAAIRSELAAGGFVTQGQLTLAIDQVVTTQGFVNSTLNAAAVAAMVRANEAYALAESINPGDIDTIQGQLAGLQAQINLLTQMPLGILPMVDGAVPPNLMYTDDGELIYWEVF